MNVFSIIATAIKNTFRNKLRTTLTVIAIFIGAFTLTLTSGIGTGVNTYIDTQLSSVGAKDVLTVTKKAPAFSTVSGPAKYDPEASKGRVATTQGPPGSTIPSLSAADLSAIAGVKGVISVDPTVTVSPDYIEYATNGKYQLAVNNFASVTKPPLAAGAQLDYQASANQIVLPTDYISSLGFTSDADAVGKTVSIGISDVTGVQHVVTATVVGVQEQTLFGGGAGLNRQLTSELNTAQHLGQAAGAVQLVGSSTVRVDPNATEAQITLIKSDLDAAGFTARTVSDQIGTFKTVIDGIVAVLNAFAIIALIAAGFGIINTLLMSVQERTREIGLMKAMGLSSGRIFGLFSTEAVFIGFLGSAMGCAVAIGAGTAVSNALANGPLSGLPGLQLVSFTPLAVANVILLVMAIALVAGTLPAYRAARQDPIESLRYE